MDSLISSMMTGILIQLVIVFALIGGLVLLLVRFGRAGGNAAASAGRMQDPVPGTLLVTGMTMPGRPAVYYMGRLTGVISAEGVEAFAVQHQGLIRTAQAPRPGQSLPVIVDRADPRNFAIEWDKVGSSADRAMDQAEALAARMREQDGDA